MEGCSFCLPHWLSLPYRLPLPYWPPLPSSLTLSPSSTPPLSLIDPHPLPHWPPPTPSLTTPSSLIDPPPPLLTPQFTCYWPQGMQSMSVRFNNAEVVFLSFFLSCCFTPTEARWPIRDGDRGGRRQQSEGSTAETARKRPERPWTAARTMEVLRRCPLAIAQRLVRCTTAVLDRVTKTMSVALLLTNNLDNSKQKTSILLSPAPPPYSWSLLGKLEGPAPPRSSKISWSFDFAWNPGLCRLSDGHFYIALFSALEQAHCAITVYKVVPYIQL